MMKYTIIDEMNTPTSKEMANILNDGILKPIQLRRGSPNISVTARIIDTTAGPYVTLGSAVPYGPQIVVAGGFIRRVVSLIFLKDQNVGVSQLIKFAPQVSVTKLGQYSYNIVSLFEPNSIERIRGMVDKSFRVLVTGMKQPKRKYEPSATRRGRRPRVGRSVGRFSSV